MPGAAIYSAGIVDQHLHTGTSSEGPALLLYCLDILYAEDAEATGRAKL